jgi:UDP-N-acetylmuramoyl-tripeptide--D-alanyl-D-alanine ligase
MGYFYFPMELADLHSLFLNSKGVTTDTRTVEPGKIFFALKGENFNGNAFAAKALEDGAAYAVIDDIAYDNNAQCILVADALETLQDLATYHRQKMNIPVIGITGSNGKTTTKELMRDVLAKKYHTLATKGNLNNHIGVPLSLLEITTEHQVAIIEMGANHVEEIAMLSRISQPDFGLITNIGQAHIGEFGGQENIIKGKCELYDHLHSKPGIAFVDSSSDILMDKSRGIERIIYGEGDQSKTPCHLISADPFLTFSWMGRQVETALIGDYNLSNIAAAIAVGIHFEVTIDDIQSAISEYIPDNNRSQLLVKKSTRIIMDAYNANPNSMEVALDNLNKMSAKKKLVILGDMLELGELSDNAHQSLIAKVEAQGLDYVFVGPLFKSMSNGAAMFYEDTAAAAKALAEYDFSDTLVLIKGSRGIRLERLLEVISP